jgi:hypothetical protein
MEEEQNFESLFGAALAELESTAQQPTAEESTEGNAEPAEGTVVESTEPEAVGETEAGEVETPASTESSNEEKAQSGPIAVTEEDVIVLPDGTEVSVKEAALRQADYTRKTQALSEERKAFDAERAAAQTAVEYVENLTKSWQANQAEVVSGFVASTQDPTLVLSQVIVELAKSDKLDPQFMETFGITPEIREKWSSEAKSHSELADVKSRLERFEREKQAVEQATSVKAQEEALIAEYENQWTQIKVSNKLDLDPTQDVEAKLEVLQYALANEVPNLASAWKALQYEKSQTAKTTAPKNAAVDAKKAASGAISSKSAGGSVVAPKAPGNIEDAVWTAFNELTSRK